MGKIKVTECGGIKGLKVVEPTITTDVRTTIAVPVITIRMPSITSRSS